MSHIFRLRSIFPLLCIFMCNVLISSARNCQIDWENWDSVEMYHRYWKRVLLKVVCMYGKGRISTSKWSMNALPIPFMLIVTSILSMEPPLKAY